MSAPTVPKAPVDISKQAAPAPPCVFATYRGTYYKKAGGGGYEYVEYEKTVKWPLSAINNQSFTPVALFRKYKERKMMQKCGGAGIREVFLVKTAGDMPSIIDIEHRLNWTADHGDLVALANSLQPQKYIHVDLVSDKRTQHSVSMQSDLYSDPVSLRSAIRLFLNEPEAFDREQKKLVERDAQAPKSMEAEIAALADDD